ncbi:8944_t:CDS:2, partial [Ambispora leptoticha]
MVWKHGGTDTGITFNRNIESWRFNRKYFDYVVANPSYLQGTIEMMQEFFKEMQHYWKELGSEYVLDLHAWAVRELENTPIDEPFIMNLLVAANTERDPNNLDKPLTDEFIRLCLPSYLLLNMSVDIQKWRQKLELRLIPFFSDNLNRVVTYDDFNEFKYIEAVYYETIHINTAVPFMFRTNQREDKITGYRWKSDTQFV